MNVGRARNFLGVLGAASLLGCAAPSAQAARGTAVLALEGHDPVALCEGRQEAGVAADSFVYGRHVYRFASPANRERFLTEPARWGIQNGGACGKMGVLSGLGNPSRWLVHEGRVYVFASEICRDRFRGDPSSYIHRADPLPVPSADEARQAREALDRAARAVGKSFDQLQTLELASDASYLNRDSTVSTARRLQQWQFPARYRELEQWPKVAYGYAMDDRASFEIEGAVDWPQDDSVRAVVARIAWREPVSLLRARRDPALVARWLGQETVADETADLVAVAIHGATTVLAIGKRTGHVLEARFPARTVTGDRPVVQRYSAFQKSGGLTLPHVSVRVVDGVVSRSPTLKLAAVSPEKSLDVGLFSPRD